MINAQYKKPYAYGLAQLTKTDTVRVKVNIGHFSDFEPILNEIDEVGKIVGSLLWGGVKLSRNRQAAAELSGDGSSPFLLASLSVQEYVH